ncbi:MAG: LysM peptidoglycan-binding domain-containing protein [Candidatus Omnitrophica bacterium]|nr:LysM peptidoglycan-binding domain-containing protein [Candidatus Omnitrophota bacterium]MBU1048033.1 LysM peptidoglycan-binding domain-containing protein [Candidatus Omnitrophota bacterium]MBU1631256.1 LysM peptidoglycan-binding domain-containing protein [Candidatus Omnitrophota bacterium]MBU1767073.1 LysM peptidoglycan-binding domain-containing protein [Candidatus Omnitrophota bacterium]MBU1889403.1 LysM peptidoglycan-binding domain-containing protein [Candidatus Omnitrophota bacterium]
MKSGILKILLVAFVSVFICVTVFAATQTEEQENLILKIRARLQEFGWRARYYQSDDTDIWGNRGIGVGGYIVGTPPGTEIPQMAVAPQMLTETELQMLKNEISQSLKTVQLQKEQTEELEYYLSQIETQLAAYKENFEIRGGTTYIVQKNDSLWKIARKEYNDANKWPLIYRANQDKLENPNLIYAGQELHIPQLKIRK